MTGIQALNAIVESLKSFHRSSSGKVPKKMVLPWGIAYDIAKLDQTVLGDLANKIWRNGVRELEKSGFFGVKVKIDFKKENGDIVVS